MDINCNIFEFMNLNLASIIQFQLVSDASAYGRTAKDASEVIEWRKVKLLTNKS